MCSAFTRTHLHYHHQQFDIYNSNHHHHNAVCTNGSTTCPVAEASGYSLPTTTQESNGLIGGLATHHHHPSSHRQGYSGEVAVKFIFKDKVPEKGWAHDPALGVIPLEIYLLRQMKHDNIVGFIDFFEDDQFFYLVTELHGTPWTDSSNTNINGCGDASDVTSSSSPTSLAPLSASSSLSLPRCSSTKSSLLSSVSTLLSVDQQHQCNPVMVSTSASSNSISSFSSPLTASSSSSRLSLSRPFSSEIINAQPQTQPRSYLRRRSSCDLFECIEQHSHLSEQLAKKIFRQIISAIHYMHGLGIVHRDIKVRYNNL